MFCSEVRASSRIMNLLVCDTAVERPKSPSILYDSFTSIVLEVESSSRLEAQ